MANVAIDFLPFLGKTHRLRVARETAPGAYLALNDDRSDGAPVVLLPRGEVPQGLEVGDSLDVFVYLDSDDRPIATLRKPLLLLDEVAFARVTDVTEVGAFVDWGLRKELFVPHAEQTREIAVGERHPIGLYVDRSHRLAGTMRVTEMLRARPTADEGAWVEGEAWRKERDIGVFVILEKRSVGLVPASEPNDLKRGDARKFRVANRLPDGKVELSLRGLTSEVLGADGQRILDVLREFPEQRFGDKSSPAVIEDYFKLSKKAFKRALGGLLKRGQVRIDDDGFAVPTKATR